MAGTLEECFFQTCRYLTVTSRNGIVMNPKKFVFWRQEVEFAGYTVGPDSVRPNAKMLSTIGEFPTPKTIRALKILLVLLASKIFKFRY